MTIQNISRLVQTAPPVRPGDDRPAIEGDPVVGEAKNVAVQPTVAQLRNVVDNINKALKQTNNILEFNMDADTKKLTVKLVDMETGDVIRQFPSEDILAIARSIARIQQGLLLNQKV